MAAGMATNGLLPVCAIYSTFLQRAYDQIIHDVCLQNLPVTFCLDRAGLSPNDGPTHHGVFDLSYLRCIPNSTILQPSDTGELAPMLEFAIQQKTPTFIRYPRGSSENIHPRTKGRTIELGEAEVRLSGEQISIWALGEFVSLAESVAKRIEMNFGLKLSVVNARFVKPLDSELLFFSCQIAPENNYH